MSVSNCIIISLFVALILITAVALFQHEKLEYDKVEYEALMERISQLEVDAQNLSEHYKQAQTEADQEVSKSIKETQDIIEIKVPADCNKAIQWGINEARTFAA